MVNDRYGALNELKRVPRDILWDRISNKLNTFLEENVTSDEWGVDTEVDMVDRTCRVVDTEPDVYEKFSLFIDYLESEDVLEYIVDTIDFSGNLDKGLASDVSEFIAGEYIRDIKREIGSYIKDFKNRMEEE